MRPYIISLIFAIGIAACGQSNPQTVVDPPSTKELCSILGRDFDTDPLCTRDNIRLLLEDEFPPGITTRDDVHKLLSPFLIEAHSRAAGGIAETYALQESLLGPVTVYFGFDTNGLLISITTGD